MAKLMPNESSVVEIASEMDQSSIPQEAMPMPVDLPFEVEDEVTIQMKEMIQGCRDVGFPSECCIYRVPIVLRELKSKAYTPNLVSIGPFHHGDERLQGMERYKQILFTRFTERAESSLDDLVRCVKDLEPKVRASYADTISYTPEELVQLTLMDAAFIIEFIMQIHNELDNDDVTAQPWIENSITMDLILLENQLPFFVIKELFNKALPHDRHGSLPSLFEIACSFFEHDGKKLESNPEVEIKHFTDLIRLSYLQGKMTERYSFSEAQNNLRYNANALKEAGIKFKARERECLLDLEFSGHTLEIPQIGVDYSTEVLFRNMIAFEGCHYPYATYITDYAVMMCWLMETNKGVDILVHNKIVSNSLADSNSVASLFNGLVENVLYRSFNAEYINICERLNDYCQYRWHRTGCFLLHDIVQAISSVLQLVLNN